MLISIVTFDSSYEYGISLIIEGELEEIKAELEENRRKLINLKMQKDAACEGHVTSPAVANGSVSPEKPVDKTKLRELKDSIDEIKVTLARFLQ